MVNANEMKGKTVSFFNETAQRLNTLSSRLEELSTAAQHVKRKVDFTRATQRTRRQAPPMLIRSLTVDGPLKAQTINGRAISDLVYKSHRRNPKLTGIVANEVLIAKDLFVNGKVDGIELSLDNVILNQPNQVLRPLTINSLSVKSIADVAQVNGLPFDQFFTLLRRKVDKKIPNLIHRLDVDTMTVGKFLNERNFTAMSIHSLKTSGDQAIVAPITIGQLTANKIIFQKVLRDQKISNVPIGDLINVADTRKRFDILQDVRFEDELFVNNTRVNERINNVNVRNGKLQVLRKRGLNQQIVTGEKFFDQVDLLSPIVLQGKIESKTLEKMNPIITVNDNLVLQGDYKITGPVTVRRIRATDDITTGNGKFGLKNLAVNGLNLFTSKTTSNKLVFKNVVEVKRNLQAVSLNEKPVANFVKSNVQDVQTIRGTTTFKGGLLVDSGTVQADVINDVDVNQLNKTTLKLFSSATQFIDGNVELASLTAAQIVSPKMNVKGKSVDLLLNTNKKQDVSQLVVDDAKVRNLVATNVHQQAGGKVFGSDLNFIIDDIVTKESSPNNIIAEKQFTDLALEHLTFTEGNEWKSTILNYENSVAQDLNVTGNVNFEKEMKIGNLVVTGTINGVSYDDMTSNWLQAEGDQVFTAPQTIAAIEIDNNLGISSETINGVNIGKMINESIWIDAPVYVENVEIAGDALVKADVFTPMVNGINLSGKLILNNTNEHQTIKKLTVDGRGEFEFLNFTYLNGIDCERLTRALVGDNKTTNLMIKGNAVFNFQPRIISLNGENLQELYGRIWIADRDVELIGDDIQFLGGVTSNGVIYSDASP
jgi:cytoskeletal protein CcmA (bactofilin family)